MRAATTILNLTSCSALPPRPDCPLVRVSTAPPLPHPALYTSRPSPACACSHLIVIATSRDLASTTCAELRTNVLRTNYSLQPSPAPWVRRALLAAGYYEAAATAGSGGGNGRPGGRAWTGAEEGEAGGPNGSGGAGTGAECLPPPLQRSLLDLTYRVRIRGFMLPRR